MIACLYVPLFPLAARLRSEPELKDEPVAVCEGGDVFGLEPDRAVDGGELTPEPCDLVGGEVVRVDDVGGEVRFGTRAARRFAVLS